MTKPNAPLAKLFYTAALSSGLFLSACSCEEGCSPSAAVDSAASMMVSVAPVISGTTVGSEPDAVLQKAVDALEAKSIGSFLKLMVPPKEMAEMEASWEEMRTEDVSAGEDAEFSQAMEMATAEGAEETLFMMVKPYLKDMEEQLQGMAMMAPMMAAGALEQAGAPDEAGAMIGALATKIADIDIGSEDKAKEAVAIVVRAARALEVKNASDMQKLTLDQGFAKLDVVYGMVVDVLGVYGLSPEETLKSVQCKLVSVEGNVATVEMSVSMFGMDAQTIPLEMERIDGRWFPKAPEPEGGMVGSGMAR